MRPKLVLTIAFFGLCISTNSQTASSTTPAEYKTGQIWNYKTARGAEGSRIVILDVQPQGKNGNLVHIRVENIPVPGCGQFRLTTVIGHIAVPEKILRKSTTDLVQDQTSLPDAYFEAYKEWQKDRRKEIVQHPLAEVAFPEAGCPIIVNLRQRS